MIIEGRNIRYGALRRWHLSYDSSQLKSKNQDPPEDKCIDVQGTTKTGPCGLSIVTKGEKSKRQGSLFIPSATRELI